MAEHEQLWLDGFGENNDTQPSDKKNKIPQQTDGPKINLAKKPEKELSKKELSYIARVKRDITRKKIENFREQINR